MQSHHIFHLLPAGLDTSIYQFFANILSSNTSIVYIFSLLADVFVVLYPIRLVYIYLVWHINNSSNYKKLSLQVFFWVLVSFAINISIQYFVRKDRPELLSWVNLIFEHLPNNSFPSDHMAVWLVFGLIIILSKYIYDADYLKNKTIKTMWYIFVALGFIMWICRVVVWVHRFTDICAGVIVWCISAYLIYIWEEFLDRYIYQYIIWLQNWLFDKLYIDKLFDIKKQ